MRTMTSPGRNVVTFCQLLTTYTGICSLETKNNGYLVSHKLVMMIIQLELLDGDADSFKDEDDGDIDNVIMMA